jgi:hypothetical protein
VDFEEKIMFEVRRIVNCAFCDKESKIYLYNKNGERFKKDLKRRPENFQWRSRSVKWDPLCRKWLCNKCYKNINSKDIFSDVYQNVTKNVNLEKESERKKNGNKKVKVVTTRDRQKESAN